MKSLKSFGIFATICVALFAGCGKKDSKSDSATTAAKTETLALMPTIDVSCGGSNCFYKSTSLALKDTDTFLQTMQMLVWIVLGNYPKEFSDMLTADQLAVVGTNGLVGKIEKQRKALEASAVAFYTGEKALSGCDAAPTSGTFKDGSNTATWTTPILKAPAGNETTGKYQKAILETIDPVHYRFEFNCGKKSMAYASYDTAKTVYQAFFYEVDSNKKTHAEFDLWTPTAIISAAEMTMQLIMTKSSTNEIEAWLSRTGPNEVDTTSHLGFRYVVHKAGSADPISFYNVGIGDGHGGDSSGTYEFSKWKAMDGVTSESVVATTAKASSGGDIPSQGCASDWNATNDELTSAALCSNLTLQKAPVSGLASSSNASLLWVDSNLSVDLKAIFP